MYSRQDIQDIPNGEIMLSCSERVNWCFISRVNELGVLRIKICETDAVRVDTRRTCKQPDQLVLCLRAGLFAEQEIDLSEAIRRAQLVTWFDVRLAAIG
jgi:hypothetical protein